METQNFKTEKEKQYEEQKRKIVLQHCVACNQQLDLLQLRLINFDDLIKGVQDTVKLTSKQLNELKGDVANIKFEPAGVKKLKKV